MNARQNPWFENDTNYRCFYAEFIDFRDLTGANGDAGWVDHRGDYFRDDYVCTFQPRYYDVSVLRKHRLS